MPEAERPTRKRRRTGPVIRTAGAVAVALAVVAGGAYVAELGPFAPGPPVPDPEATAQARAFLADWAQGRLADAGGRTTSPGKAQEVLRNFTTGLAVDKPTLTAHSARIAQDGTVDVPFTAAMPVADLGTWTYDGTVPLRKQDDGSWKVAWTLSLVHPHLSDAEKFRLDREGADGPKATDRAGRALSKDTHPSLAPVLAQAARAAGAGPGGAIRRVDRATGEIKGTEATFGKQPSRTADQPIRTTIDSAWQTAAEKALAAKTDGKNAALVALRVDNGEILAVANSPSGFNRAVSGTYAPGSTWKVVTTSALLLKDAVKPEDIVDCPKYLTVGKQFHNVETSEHRNATFLKDFTESCNTAFISLRDKLGDRELGDVARKYFGVGQEWHTGIPSFDGSVPAPRDDTEKAASMIGQGRVLANPLIMASVTATAVSGTFHQPTITRGNKDTTTTSRLPQNVVERLRQMMRATVTDGTAKVLDGLPGDVGAKTGTAEVTEDAPNNGWLVAHRGNVAIACVVEQGKTGGASAGPVVRSVLSDVAGDPS
ncbi:penicillin-binding transpeptidase domain-containing protein [Streptomyces morookaense]|uniref:Penicillin-binding protein n=1 Tax=Streptomyces morookaense TaxID=1970 RepID=A0A7Y7AZS3_STRMO|nr:penicillin-binding transpeptidase domain-containing protein [Streptomyces morookaense]NVK76388.1 penicillin-binding protein [Streptomyces morookaense]GHF06667.1 penicillin-binding protein [Streptomyces morookaense]